MPDVPDDDDDQNGRREKEDAKLGPKNLQTPSVTIFTPGSVKTDLAIWRFFEALTKPST